MARGADDGRLCRPKPGFHTEETGRRALRQRPERSREPGAQEPQEPQGEAPGGAGRRGRREPRVLLRPATFPRHPPTGRSGPPRIHPRPRSGRAVVAQRQPLPRRPGPGRGPRRSRARAAVGAAPAATRVGFAAQAPAKEASVSGSSLAKRSAAIVAVRMMRSSVCRHRTILSRLSCGVPPPGKQSGAGAEGPTRPVSRRPRRPEPGGPAKQVKKSERKRPVLPLTREVHEGTGQHQASASRCCHSSRGRLPTGAAPPGSKGPGWPLLLVLERRAGKPEKHTPPVWASHPPAS